MMLRKVTPLEGLKACRKDASLFMCADLTNPISRNPYCIIADKCYKVYLDGSRKQLMDSFGSLDDLERDFADMKDEMFIGSMEDIRAEIKRIIAESNEVFKYAMKNPTVYTELDGPLIKHFNS